MMALFGAMMILWGVAEICRAQSEQALTYVTVKKRPTGLPYAPILQVRHLQAELLLSAESTFQSAGNCSSLHHRSNLPAFAGGSVDWPLVMRCLAPRICETAGLRFDPATSKAH